MKVSVIITVFNEADSIEALLSSLLRQTRPADEVVVTDAGSTDGTREKLAEWSGQHPMIKVIDHPGNRSVGRNAAVRAASGDVVACIDGGCVADVDWLERLIEPFFRGAEFVAGFYRPEGDTALSTCIGLVMVYVREEAEHAEFLPSTRSMAFIRGVWESVGGFPEDTEFAEDTLFAQRVIDAGSPLVRALNAQVGWLPPSTLATLARTSFRWARGDAEADLRGPVYRRLIVGYGGALAAVALGFWWRPLSWLGVAGLVLDTARRTRFKYRWGPRPEGLALIPLAHLTSTYASVLGFLVGSLRQSPKIE